MKRFHVHISVADLDASIAFYGKLFGTAPAKQREDYAKWVLEDPRLNFAISARGHAIGVNHMGFQAEASEELEALKRLAEDASGGRILGQGEAACCYAKSAKHWTLDPQGIAWEHFQTLSDSPVFGEDSAVAAGACCIPIKAPAGESSALAAACCLPAKAAISGSEVPASGVGNCCS